MKTMQTTNPIDDWFSESPPITEAVESRLIASARELETDAPFQADLLKGWFVNGVSEAMEEEGLSQATLAKKWGRTRQYLSKLLNEDRRINFTIETMVELSLILGRKLKIVMLKPNEEWQREMVPKSGKKETAPA